MLKILSLFGCIGLLVLMNGCASPETPDTTNELTESGESKFISVQHVLIGFEGSVPGKSVTRSREEAEKLANEILEKAKAGEDFGSLVSAYTDDSPPGIYHMSNFGVSGKMSGIGAGEDVFPRDQMVPAFGDVGFPLQIGEIGMSIYDERKSPYGFHIVKRLK